MNRKKAKFLGLDQLAYKLIGTCKTRDEACHRLESVREGAVQVVICYFTKSRSKSKRRATLV